VTDWQWASNVKKPKCRHNLQRKPGEPVLSLPPPDRLAVELISVLWQREIVE